MPSKRASILSPTANFGAPPAGGGEASVGISGGDAGDASTGGRSGAAVGEASTSGELGDTSTAGESMDDATEGTSGDSGVGGASGGVLIGTSPRGGATTLPRLSMASCMSRTTWATLTTKGARNLEWLSFNAA